ncbi:MAG TPA: hypothetical protein GX707_13690 [Epulopiscium sp.]|nr:hypothetical protein [Candidatus Epulonipiscium sp.]
MKIKALVSFSGAFSMYKGEISECNDKAILRDLLQAKYIEEVKEIKPKKDVKPKDGGKSNNSKTKGK